MKALRSNCSKLFGQLLSLLRRITESLLNSLSFQDGFGTFNDITEALSNHNAAALNSQTLSVLKKTVESWKYQSFSFASSQSLPSSQNNDEKNIIVSNGILLLGHFCWLIKYNGSSIVEGALTDRNRHDNAESSLFLFSTSSSFVSEEQFRSAFEIADTDGDGIIDLKEIQDALMALSLGELYEDSYVDDRSNGDSASKTIREQKEMSPSVTISNLSYDEFLLIYGSNLSSPVTDGEFSSTEKFHHALDKLIATNYLSWSLLLTGNAFRSFRLQLSKDLGLEDLLSSTSNTPSAIDKNKKFKSRWLRRLDESSNSSTLYDNNDENSSLPASCSFSLISTLFVISSTVNKYFISIDLFQQFYPCKGVSVLDEPSDFLFLTSSDDCNKPINIIDFVRKFVQFLTVTLIVNTYDGMIINKIETLSEANNANRSWNDSFDDVTIQCYFDLIILKEALANSSSSVSLNHSQCVDLLNNCINKIEVSLDPVMNEFILQHIKENSKIFVSSLSFVLPWIEKGKPLLSFDDNTDVTNVSKSDTSASVLSQLLPSFVMGATSSYSVTRFTLLPLALSTQPLNNKAEYSGFSLESRATVVAKGESKSKVVTSEQQVNSSTSNILKWW
jgi:hypothetical protein